MNVIIPVGGLGTRLRPQTWSRPKPLVSVAGKPVLGHVLDSLTGLTLDRVVFVTGFLGDQIEEYVRSNYQYDAVFVRQEEPRGQSHAIIKARGQIAGPTIVIFPDMIFEADLESLESIDCDGAIFVKEVDDPRRFGVVVLDGDRVTHLIEKPDDPTSNLAVMGIYYVSEVRNLFRAIDAQMADDVKTKGEYFLADALQMMIDDGAHFTTIPATVWEDCGTPSALLNTNRYLLSRSDDTPNVEGSVIIPPVFIADSARIERSVIGPNASIGDNVHVDRALIRDSIVDAGAVIESAMLTRSIIGRDAFVRGEPLRVNVGDSADIDLRSTGDNGRD
ncbi:MAG TPA: sugar phosphate nucleotidyltransferase [Thermomicrobiales bacterium]|nr:sugar phosphate nucleotidyltransferase [Thermomicrobiales bacterium]